MRILIINQPFWPDVVATAQHLADWTEELVSRGHEVTLIASRSVYGKQGGDLPKRETHKEVRIFREGVNLFKKGSIFTRLIDFGMFHWLALWRTMTLPRQDVVVCLTTPPFIGVVGMLVKIARGSRYVQYEMDLYPDVPVALGVMKAGSLLTRVFEGIHRKMLRSADRVVVLGRCMRRVIEGKGIAAEKLVLITPWADAEEIRPMAREGNGFRIERKLGDAFVIMYSGNLGLGHDIGTMTGAITALRNSADPRDRECHFVFIGGGKRMAELEMFVAANKLTNVSILGYQARERLGETLSAGDVHLITQAAGTSGLIVPSKFYGILAAGRRSIYIGPADTEVAYVIQERDVGRVLEIGDVEGLLSAIRELRDGRSAGTGEEERIRGVLRDSFSRRVCTEKLTAMVEALV